MEYQTDFSMPLELSFLYNSECWLNANSVIDLGTGNGYYLSKLVSLFPGKSYTGVDVEPELTSEATRRFSNKDLYRNSNIVIETKDLFDVKGKYDLVFGRLIVQHLESIDGFMEHVQDILQPEGSLLIIDSDDSMRKFLPYLPYMTKFFDELRKSRQDSGCDRDAGFLIGEKAEKFNYSLEGNTRLVIPTTIKENKQLFYNSYKTVFEIARKEYGVEFDYKTLNEELNAWFENDVSYAQIGVHLSLYKLSNL